MEKANFLTLREIAGAIYDSESIAGSKDEHYKEFTKKFKEYCMAVGINVKHLQGSNSRYRFQGKEIEFVAQIIKNFSQSPISNLREGAYDEVRWSFYEEIEGFIKSVMYNCEKKDSEINAQLVAFRHKTGWIYRRDITQMKGVVIKKVNAFYKTAISTGGLGNDDRLLIFQVARREFANEVETFFSRWNGILEEFKEQRTNETVDIDMNVDQLELLELGRKVSMCLQSLIEDDHELAGWKTELEGLQLERKRGNQKAMTSLETRISEREASCMVTVQNELGITSGLLKEIGTAESNWTSSHTILRGILEELQIERVNQI